MNNIIGGCPCSGGNSINTLLFFAVLAVGWLLFTHLKPLIKSKGKLLMNKNIVIIVGLIAVVGVVIMLKQQGKSQTNGPVAPAVTAITDVKPAESVVSENITQLPRLIDLGAGKCIPCKMMAPILEEMKTQYAGKLDVTFYDVWENPDKAKEYSVNIIPTQIFYDAAGKELFRHEGFFSKEDILAKFKEFGIELSGGEKTTGL